MTMGLDTSNDLHGAPLDRAPQPDFGPYVPGYGVPNDQPPPRPQAPLPPAIDLPDPYQAAGVTQAQIDADARHNLESPNDGYNENANQYFHGVQNSFEVIPNLLYRGANPGGSGDDPQDPGGQWSEQNLMQNLSQMKQQGITVDVDFESPDPKDPCVAARINAEAQACAALGIQFVNIPLSTKTPPTPEQQQQLLDTIKQAQQDGGQVYCHCREGRDRTGNMMAYVRENQSYISPNLQDWSPTQARAEMENDGYNSYKQNKEPAMKIPDTPMPPPG